MLKVHINTCTVWRVMNYSVCVGICACASIENKGWMIFLYLASTVGDIGHNLTGNVLLIHPQRPHSWTLHQWVLRYNSRPKLIRPVNLINPMLVSQRQQHLIIQIVRINAHTNIPTVSSIPTLYNNVLAWCYVETYNTLMVVQNINVTEIHFEVCDW